MKIGFFAVGIADTARPEMITAIATIAERLGFATVWAPEHVVLLENFASRYPYSGDGKIPVPTTTPLLDPFIALTYAAAHTSRIRLATGICILPQRNPLVLAKVAASLDYLSNGRFALGIGIGWLEEEFKAIGVPWERRTERTREYVEAMRNLWGDERSTYRVNSSISKMRGASPNQSRGESCRFWWAGRPSRLSSGPRHTAMAGADLI
jgi:probable F420-dependent oxidoreductase